MVQLFFSTWFLAASLIGCDAFIDSADDAEGSEESENSDDGGGGSIQSEDDFKEAWVEGLCRAEEECTPNDFYDYWEDVEQCLDEYEDYVDEEWDSGDCDFDSNAANDCIDALNAYENSCDDNDYDDVEDNCDDVFDCD